MIKLFLKKTTLFLLLVCLMVLIVSASLSHFLNKKSRFILSNESTSIVFGHSHPEMAFNDSLISNFKNLAQAGESYFYTYVKAKQVFKNNPQIKNVFIEFSNIDVTQIRDEEIWNDKYINWRYPTYSAWMNLEEQFFLFTKNPKSLIATLPKTYKKQFNRINSKNFNIMSITGGYLYLKGSKLDSLIKLKINLEKPDPKYFKKSTYNLYYLNKLVELCLKNNKQVYFVRSPLYKDSFYRWNEELYQQVKKEQFTNVQLLDYVDFNVPNGYFRDLHHLNYKGAEKFSKMFNNWLQQNTLKETK